MSRITAAFEWVEERLEKGLWYRRAYLAAALAQNMVVVQWAMRFAEISARPGMEVAAILTGVGGMSAALTAHAFQAYTTSRGSP